MRLCAHPTSTRPPLETARKNAADLGARVEFAHGSWFDTDMPSEGKWDIIVSNPPYIENGDKHLSQGDLRFEPQIALTDFSDGLSCIRTLAQARPTVWREGGFLLLEHGFDQGAAVRGVLAENGFREWKPCRTWRVWTGLRWGSI